jgi:hypothetical protein
MHIFDDGGKMLIVRKWGIKFEQAKNNNLSS